MTEQEQETADTVKLGSDAIIDALNGIPYNIAVVACLDAATRIIKTANGLSNPLALAKLKQVLIAIQESEAIVSEKTSN